MSAFITGIPDCLPSGNPIDEVKSLSGTTFVVQVTGIFYEYENKLFILFGNVDYEIAEDLQSFLNDIMAEITPSSSLFLDLRNTYEDIFNVYRVRNRSLVLFRYSHWKYPI